MLAAFRKFILKGNLVEIAVGLILALAFSAVVTSLVEDILMQIVGAIAGQPDFSTLVIELGDGELRYDAFLNALIIGFLLFLVGKASNTMAAARRRGDEPPDEVTEDIALAREIRDALGRPVS